MAAIDGEESLRFLSSADPPLFLSPSSDLSRHARAASRHLYSSLLPICPKPKPPLEELLVGESFHAEQIWCQIDLISRPVVSMLRREIKRIERDPPRPSAAQKEEVEVKEEEEKEEEEDEEEEEEEEEEEDEEDGEEDEEQEEEEESDGGEDQEGNGVEDEFLKIKELEEYLEKDEEREYGEIKGKRRKKKEEEEEDDDEEENDEDEEDDEVDLPVKFLALLFLWCIPDALL